MLGGLSQWREPGKMGTGAVLCAIAGPKKILTTSSMIAKKDLIEFPLTNV
jgi:hypothetical protein